MSIQYGYVSKYLSVIGFVLGHKRYAVIAVVSFLLLATLYWFVTMPQFLQHFEMTFAADPLLTVGRVGIIMGVAVIGGINIALVVFRLCNQNKMSCCSGMKKASSGVFGGALSAFTPGCPACTSLLSVALGAAGGLAALPFGGAELGIISLFAVTFSMFWITKDIRKTIRFNT